MGGVVIDAVDGGKPRLFGCCNRDTGRATGSTGDVATTGCGDRKRSVVNGVGDPDIFLRCVGMGGEAGGATTGGCEERDGSSERSPCLRAAETNGAAVATDACESMALPVATLHGSV